MILSKSNILQYLAQKNLIDWQTTIEHIIVHNESKNFGFQLRTNNKNFFLKQSKTNQVSEIINFKRECLFYSLILKNSDFYIIHPHLPLFFGYDPIHYISVFGLIENTKNINEYIKNDILSLQLSENLGRIFKKINTCGIFKTDEINYNKTLTFFHIQNDIYKAEFASNYAFTKKLIDNIFNNNVLFGGISKANNLWNVNGIVHGDIKFENFLIQINTEELYIIDWESVSFGDTTWDFACMLRSIIMDSILKENIVLIALNPIHSNEKLKRRIKAFLKGYDPDFNKVQCEKILLFLAVSILEKIVELAQSGSKLEIKNSQFMSISESLIMNQADYFYLFEK